MQPNWYEFFYVGGAYLGLSLRESKKRELLVCWFGLVKNQQTRSGKTDISSPLSASCLALPILTSLAAAAAPIQQEDID